MITSRDIELRIRTRDLTGGSLADITRQTKELAEEFERLNKDTAAGVNNTNEFREALSTFGREIDRQTLALNKLNADQEQQIRRRDQLNTAIAQSTTRLRDLRAQQEATNNQSVRMTQSIEREEKALQTLNQQLVTTNTQIDRNDKLMEEAGLSTRNFQQNLQTLGTSLNSTNVLLRDMEKTMLSVPRRSREATAALRDQANAEKAVAVEADRRAKMVEAAERSIATAKARIAAEEKRRDAEFMETQMRLEAFRRKQAADQARDAEARKKQLADEAALRKANFEREMQQLMQQRRETEAFIRATGTPPPGAPPRRPGSPMPGGVPGAARPVNALGLRPDQMTNLTYQGFDIVQQLGSGQAPGIVLLQQGSQIVQLFTGNLMRLLPILPLVAVGIGAVAVAVAGLTRMLRDAESTRTFTAMIGAGPGGTNMTGAGVTALRNQLVGAGVPFAESGTGIQQALRSGFGDQAAIESFIRMGRNIADIYGTDVKQAINEVVTAFANGREGVVGLISSYNLLQPAQRQQIRDLYDSGKQADATRLAHKLLNETLSEQAKTAVSPTTAAVRNLSAAWNQLMETFSNSSAMAGMVNLWAKFIGYLESAIGWIDRLLQKIDAAPDWVKATMKAAASGLMTATIPGVGAAVGVAGALWPAGGGGSAPGTPMPFGAPGFGRLDLSRNLTMSPEQRAMASLVNQAMASLPSDVVARLISTTRSGSTTEHGPDAQRAIDIELVRNGQVLPGAMRRPGPVDPLYIKLDELIMAMREQMGINVGVGGQFRTGGPDYGHFSYGGVEGQRQTGRPVIAASTTAAGGGPNVIRAPTEEEIKNATRFNQELERQRLAQATANYEIARRNQLELEKRKAEQEMPGPPGDPVLEKQREEVVNRRMAQNDLDHRAKVQTFEDNLARIRATAGPRYNELLAAGNEMLAKRQQLYGSNMTLEQQNQAILDGIAEKQAELARADQTREAARQLNLQIAALQRQAEMKDYESLESRLKGVDLQLENVYGTLKKMKEEGKVDFLDKDIEQKIDRVRDRLKSMAESDFFKDKSNAIVRERRDLIATINQEVENGTKTITQGQAEIKQAYADTNGELNKTLDAWTKFLQTTKDIDPTTVRKLLAEIQKIRVESQYIDPLWKTIKDTFAQSFGQGMTNVLNSVGEAIGGLITKTMSWKDAMNSMRNAAMNFFAQLLKDIANAIIRLEAAKIASWITGGTSSGSSSSGGIIGSLFGAIFGKSSSTTATAAAGTAATTTTAAASPSFFSFLGFHKGGVVGQGGAPGYESVPASWWDAAPRYHNGTMVGLAPDEQRAILRRGEEVLSRDSPRNIMNGGGGRAINIRSVLVDDPQRVPNAMASTAGERIVVQHLVKNAATVRQLVKG